MEIDLDFVCECLFIVNYKWDVIRLELESNGIVVII